MFTCRTPGINCSVLLLSACYIASLTISSAVSAACADSVKVNGKYYRVTERWCGKKIDSSTCASSDQLVPLPDTCTFEDYRIYVLKETRDAFVKMADSARKAGINLQADSGFRSLGFQAKIISQRMEEGVPFDKVIAFVAPPGYSEHHTGRALDLVPSEARFVHTPVYKWLTANASRFGFRESIPEDSTGKSYWESWHWYYTGTAK